MKNRKSKFDHDTCKVRKLASSKELLILRVALFSKSPNDATDGSYELSKLASNSACSLVAKRCSTPCSSPWSVTAFQVTLQE